VTGGDFSSSKPLLLFVHGFPESWATWHAQLVYFARQGHPVAAFDMRGYGLSSAPAEVEAYSGTHLTADVRAVVRHLRAQLTSPRSAEHEVVVVAHDWGSMVNWQVGWLTASSPSPKLEISRFVLASAPHPEAFNEYAFFQDRLQLLCGWYVLWFQVPFLPAFWLYSNPGFFVRFLLKSSDPDITRSCFSNPDTCRGMTHYYKAMVREQMSGVHKAHAESKHYPRGGGALLIKHAELFHTDCVLCLLFPLQQQERHCARADPRARAAAVGFPRRGAG